jgi:hypothetical protein
MQATRATHTFTLTTLGFTTQETHLELIQTMVISLVVLLTDTAICAHLVAPLVDLPTNQTQHTFPDMRTEAAHILFTTLVLRQTGHGRAVRRRQTLLTF